MTDNTDKQIDGLKKLSKEDLAKSRRIVLETIGELRDEAPAKAVPAASSGIGGEVAKKLDSVASQPKRMPEKTEEIPSKPGKTDAGKSSSVSVFTIPEHQSGSRPSSLAPDFTKPFTAIDGIRSAGLKKDAVNTPAPEWKSVTVKKTDPRPEDAAHQLKPEEVTAAALLVEKAIEADSQSEKKPAPVLEKTKTPLPVIQAESRNKDKLVKKDLPEKPKKPKKQSQPLKLRLADSFLALRSKSLALAHVLARIFTLSFVLFLLVYSIIAVVELKLSVDNSFFRTVNRYLPVPAVITRTGIIDYYRYKDIAEKNGIIDDSEDAIETVKFALARQLAYAQLLEKYRLEAGNGISADESFTAKISDLLVRDESINQVGIERIRKIKTMIDSQGDFVQVAGKYGDELGQVTITPETAKNYPYSSMVKDMYKNQLSDIVFTPEGYYIFKCYDNNGSRLALSFAFVRAKTLDQYLDETAQTMKMWSLVK